MRLIGTGDFYKKIMKVAVPIMIQNGITNFVSMLDNIMVGRVGTDAMSGVSIVNQLFFVYVLCLFGATAGIGIFTAQFSGKGDNEGVKYTMRIKLAVSLVLALIWTAVFVFFGQELIRLWLQGESGSGNIENTLLSARRYMMVSIFQIPPMALSMSYAGTLRESGETILPMKAGVAAVILNLIGNYVLIYGKFGAPALGVVGAALATVISRFVEAFIEIYWTHTHVRRNPFVTGLYESLFVPADLVKNIALKSSPVLLNEFLWSGGMTMLNQQYSLMGLEVVAALNISSTVSNVFNIVFIAMGEATAIILGQELGMKKNDKAVILEKAHQLTFFSVSACILSGAALFAVSPYFPLIYNTSDTIRALATGFMRISAVFMPIYAYENTTYFTLRSGGRTWITFLFDSAFIWVVSIPALYVLVRFSGLTILRVFACVQLMDIIKCCIGFIMVRKGIWINDLTEYVSDH